MVEAKLLRKKLKNGLIVDKWDLVTIIEKQQAEIKSMQERMVVAEKELNHMRSFFGCDPAYYGMTSAEPVAYKAWHKDLGWTYHDWKDGFTAEGVVPLYTHPAKTLTDEEILQLWMQKNTLGGAQNIVDFARAILRKAQEK